MSDIPEALVEKGYATYLRVTPTNVGWDVVHAVLAAVWSDLPAARPVVDRAALGRAVINFCAKGSALERADALLASGIFQDAADVRRAVAAEIAAAIERRRLRRRHRWMRSHRWSGRDEACWSQGMWDAARIARQAAQR